MGLRFIYGRSGSGKSTFCVENIKSRIEEGANHPLILLVPEQFSLQAEKALVKATSQGGTIGCEVLTFRRMAYRVFNEAGGITKKRLNSAGKCMLIFRILQNHSKDFKIFKNPASHKGFVNIVSDLITEFKRHNVSPEGLEKVSTKISNSEQFLKQKLTEIHTIYSQFQKYVQDNYMDLDDDLTFLCRKLNDSDQYNKAEIWIDEFSGFTPQEFSVIEKLMLKAANINICMRTDCLVNEVVADSCSLFSPITKTVDKIVKIANVNRIKIEKPVQLTQSPLPRFKHSKELAHLESYLFEYPSKSFFKTTDDIEILASSGIHQEIEDTARKIIELCRDKDYRFTDIAVITGNLEAYEKSIHNIFTLYEIPLFIDTKRSITAHPLVSLVLSALDIYIKNWSYETVFRYLKTALINIEPEEVDIIENYVLAFGIRGSRWTKDADWEYIPEGLSDSSSDDKEIACAKLSRINAVRTKVREPLINFFNQAKGRKTAVQICSALYKLLQETGSDKKTENYIDYFKNNGLLDLSNEYSQIWNILMEVFDQMVEVLGDSRLTIEKFRDILASGLNEYKIGLVPPSLDQVQVGSTGRTINHNIKALFVLGVNDGVFPSSFNDEGIITDRERNLLKETGLELAVDTKTRTFEENYFTYEILTTPSHYLGISYPVSDEQGRAMRPSGVIAMLRSIFPNLTEKSNIIEKDDEKNNLELISTQTPTFNELLKRIKRKATGFSVNDMWYDVGAWYMANENWNKRFLSALSGLNYSNSAERLDSNTISKTTGEMMNTSISRLERYANCPFAYFVQYGLKAKERKIFRLTPPDVGTFMHNIIDAFSKSLAKQNLSWRSLEKELCDSMVSEIVDEELENLSGSILNSSKRYFYLTRRLKRIMSRAVWVIAEHIRRSGFEPIDYEVTFGLDGRIPPIVLKLSNGRNIKLTGRIDRIDAMTTDDGTFIRIIDYKSGTRDFSLQDVFYGLQLQLITYLDAISEIGIKGADNLLPGGMLYFKIDDPIIRSKGDMTAEEIEKAIMKQLKMNGLLLADVKLIKGMDSEISGSSDIIPARLNKGDVLAKSSSVATSEQFVKLRKHARQLLKKICGEILDGNITISPWKYKKQVPCRFCKFSSVCRFDPSISDNKYRILYDIKDEDIWNKL